MNKYILLFSLIAVGIIYKGICIMSLPVTLVVAPIVICIVLLVFLIISNIYNKFTKNSIKERFYIKHPIHTIITLIMVCFISSNIFLYLVTHVMGKETVLNETSPDKKIDIRIVSKEFGGGIIVYVKDNTSDAQKLKELLRYDINEDLTSIGSGNIFLKWSYNVAMLQIYGESETLYLDIWMDDKTNEFKYKLNSVKKTNFVDNEIRTINKTYLTIYNYFYSLFITT